MDCQERQIAQIAAQSLGVPVRSVRVRRMPGGRTRVRVALARPVEVRPDLAGRVTAAGVLDLGTVGVTTPAG